MCSRRPPAFPGAAHVPPPPGRARARGRGAIGHAASDPLPVVLHDALPVVAPAFIWCQLANELSPYDLVALGDAIVTGRRRGSVRAPALATLDELADAAAYWGSRRGARTLATALPRIRVGAESPKETHQAQDRRCRPPRAAAEPGRAAGVGAGGASRSRLPRAADRPRVPRGHPSHRATALAGRPPPAARPRGRWVARHRGHC